MLSGEYWSNKSQLGSLWATTAASKVQGSDMDGYELEAQEKVSYRTSSVAKCWYAAISLNILSDISLQLLEYLQGRLLLETTRPEFSEMPFRFAEIAKVLLDVYVISPSLYPTTLNVKRRM